MCGSDRLKSMGTEQTSSFGAELRRYREAAGLTQEQLAERAGLATAAISALERGVRQRPYPHTLQALATALQLTDAERTVFVNVVRKSGQAPPSPTTGTLITSL